MTIDPHLFSIILTAVLSAFGYLLARRASRQEQDIVELRAQHAKDVADLKDQHIKELADLKEQHARDIAALWAAHDRDATRLQDLELDIAKRHYVKEELDVRFTELKDTIRETMKILGDKFDRLSGALLTHGTAP